MSKIKTWIDPETGWTMAESKDGRKVRVLCMDAEGDFPIVGVVLDSPWSIPVCAWTKDGRRWVGGQPGEDSRSLVTEPEPQDPIPCPFCGKEADQSQPPLSKNCFRCPDYSCPAGKAFVPIDHWNRRVSTGPTWEQIDEARRRLQVENRESPVMVKFALSYLPTRPEDKR